MPGSEQLPQAPQQLPIQEIGAQGTAPEQVIDEPHQPTEADVGWQSLETFSLYDDGDMGAWLDDPSEEVSIIADTAAQLFNRGIEIPEGAEVQGVTKQDMDKWYASLTPEAREFEDSSRKANDIKEAKKSIVAARVEAVMPELLDGRLPTDLEALLGPNYAIGINQSEATGSAEEAQALLSKYGGVDMLDYSALTKRFIMVDKNHPGVAEGAVLSGYYNNPDVGRYIIAVPVPEGAPANLDTLGIEGGPPDLKLERQEGRSSVNAKYVVGYIDQDGEMHQNANFMHSSEPQLVAPVQQSTENWV